MAEKPALLLAKRALVKKFGDHLMGSSAKIAIADKRITTGSLFLDICIGGGVPVGRTTALWGERSGGKTTTAIRIAGRPCCCHSLSAGRSTAASRSIRSRCRRLPACGRASTECGGAHDRAHAAARIVRELLLA